MRTTRATLVALFDAMRELSHEERGRVLTWAIDRALGVIPMAGWQSLSTVVEPLAAMLANGAPLRVMVILHVNTSFYFLAQGCIAAAPIQWVARPDCEPATIEDLKQNSVPNFLFSDQAAAYTALASIGFRSAGHYEGIEFRSV